ncbi:hypothetical protein PLESTB_000274800 [Pleodorina starrii]|uniref:SCP domain-containing protein n=1 Tax=Pleodorina starrii TaxID=330485 RepID=A0A9W6EY64_9CHLO|nr:hypothetical protein PLESTB_000274800 [Pleodorina starrii]GLC65510.1 hypothetical protein PLESTF_000304500 [Pleodorina starrii]
MEFDTGATSPLGPLHPHSPAVQPEPEPGPEPARRAPLLDPPTFPPFAPLGASLSGTAGGESGGGGVTNGDGDGSGGGGDGSYNEYGAFGDAGAEGMGIRALPPPPPLDPGLGVVDPSEQEPDVPTLAYSPDSPADVTNQEDGDKYDTAVAPSPPPPPPPPPPQSAAAAGDDGGSFSPTVPSEPAWPDPPYWPARSPPPPKRTTPTSASSSPSPSTDGGKCSDAAATLDKINRYRAVHQVNPLSWSAGLAAAAQAYANDLAADGCTAPLVHSSLGELLYWTTGASSSCRNAVSDWYSEVAMYDFNTSTPFTDNVLRSRNDISHFTQLVWRSSYMVGCGLQRSSVGYYSPCTYVVCRFVSPGNQKGDLPFLMNVLPKLS